MITSLTTLLLYLILLAFVRPAPNQLKAAPIPLSVHLWSIKISLLLGTLLIIIFFFITDGTFDHIDPERFYPYALSSPFELSIRGLFSLFTNLFLHANFYHLIANLFMLALLSRYEARVGTRRYLSVLIISALVSDLSLLFYSDNTVITGISGGLYGLAAAFFVDHKQISTKEWSYALFSFIVLAFLFGLIDTFDDALHELPLSLDYYGHFLGALTAVVYTRSLPLK